MATNGGGDDLMVVCAWCKAVLQEGHPTGPDQISHGCCIPCKRKYFPTLDDAETCPCGHPDHSPYQCGNRDEDGVPCDCAGVKATVSA